MNCPLCNVNIPPEKQVRIDSERMRCPTCLCLRDDEKGISRALNYNGLAKFSRTAPKAIQGPLTATPFTSAMRIKNAKSVSFVHAAGKLPISRLKCTLLPIDLPGGRPTRPQDAPLLTE